MSATLQKPKHVETRQNVVILVAFLLSPVLVRAQTGPALRVHGSFIPDTTVAGILLCDSTSAIAVAGRIPYDELLPNGPSGVPSRVYFHNHDRTEVLTMIFHQGTYQNTYAEFVISTHVKDQVRSALPTKYFSTGRGVRLGMSEADIIRIFGNGHWRGVGNNGNVILGYAIKDPSTSSLLQRFNLPSYYAHFMFEQGRLFEYRFGFEAP